MITITQPGVYDFHGHIVEADNSDCAVSILASDVILRRLRVLCRNMTYGIKIGENTRNIMVEECTVASGGPGRGVDDGIYAKAVSDLTVRNCNISSCHQYGIRLWHVGGFEVSQCRIEDIGYAGFAGLSVSCGLVVGNQVQAITGSPNAYGMSASRYTDQGEQDVEPDSKDVMFRDNYIRDVPHWVGLDTHSGQRISFLNNTVLKCKMGIGVGESKNSAGVYAYTPRGCVVSGNIVDSERDDGSAGFGIAVTGIHEDPAEGCIVAGNVVRRHGNQSEPYGGALYVRDARSLVVSGNVWIEPSPQLSIYHDVTGFVFAGNVVQDAWCDDPIVHDSNCFAVYGPGCSGFMSGNSFVRANKVAQWVNTQLVRIQPGNNVVEGVIS